MGLEVADIFRAYGKQYRERYLLPRHYLKAMYAIEHCRTATLGGHVEECEQCGHRRVHYNSCRNRHCPKCQKLSTVKWIEDRNADILPVPYFHVVFTVPDLLNPLILRNQKTMYNLLFSAASQTLKELARDPRHLGAEIGITCVLHTWGQNLMDHPHLHCLIPGGGLSPDHSRWIKCRNDFFIHHKVIAKKFRGKFLSLLKQLFRAGELQFPGNIAHLAHGRAFQSLLNRLWNKKWIVNCKDPFKYPDKVLEYLGRYTHRIAISNHRLIKMEKGKVFFRWKDYSDNDRWKVMSLDAFEFIRRFLLHILPDGFMKIRHYGFLGNCCKKKKLSLCRKLLHVAPTEDRQRLQEKQWQDILCELTGTDLSICPACENGRMVVKRIITPRHLKPPGLRRIPA